MEARQGKAGNRKVTMFRQDTITGVFNPRKLGCT